MAGKVLASPEAIFSPKRNHSKVILRQHSGGNALSGTIRARHAILASAALLASSAAMAAAQAPSQSSTTLSGDTWPVLLVRALGALAWPGAALLIVLLMRKPLLAFLEQTSILTATIGGVKFELTKGDAQKLLNAALEGIRGLSDAHYALFHAVREREGERVDQILPGFKREASPVNYQHDLLRQLRDLKLIRPRIGGPWRAESIPTITKFAALLIHAKPDAIPTPSSPGAFLDAEKCKAAIERANSAG